MFSCSTSPSIVWPRENEARRAQHGTTMKQINSSPHKPDYGRILAYALVASIALLTGYILGLLGGQLTGGSRAGWPPPPVNPRSFSP